MSTKDIAALIRKDIAAAQKSGVLPKGKFSVRMARFAGGSSITVEVVDVDVVLFNVERFHLIEKYPHDFYNRPEFRDVPHHTPEGERILAALDAIVCKYHVDKSDISSDYFHVNFYKHIEARAQERKERGLCGVHVEGYGLAAPTQKTNEAPAPVQPNKAPTPKLTLVKSPPVRSPFDVLCDPDASEAEIQQALTIVS